MRALLIVTDSEAVPVFERVLAEEREGFTVVPASVGLGRSGLKAGDRIHPGASSLLLTVAPEEEAASLLELLRRARDGANVGDRTRIWSFPVDEAD
jgi:hypothetical protein